MAQVTKQIVSPVFVTESGDSYIALDGKAFLVKENEIVETEITSAPGEFRSLVLALNNFKLTNEGLTWYNGVSRIKFNRETEKFFVNNSEVLSESLTNHLLASGIVNYVNKSKIQLFEYAAQNINNFVFLDFAQKIEEGDIKCYVMRLNEDFYVYRMNEANKIYKFGKLDANTAFDYVKEQTGYEIVDMTHELLEGARKNAAEKLEKINLLEQMIAFLKDQRGIIAEADKSIQEIKEADTLINSEIKRLEEEIESIKSGIIEEDDSELNNEESNNEEVTEEDESTDDETGHSTETDEAESNESEETEEVEDKDAKEVEESETEAEDEEVEDEATKESAAEEIEKEEAEMGEPEEADSEAEPETMATEDEDANEEVVDRGDGFVPATLKYEVGEFAEGTEIQVDAEDYTTSGQDESITVFMKDSEKPIKINKRDILLADGETV
jgi:hypothetical protein